MGKIFGCQGDFAQDKVPYVKLSKFHSPVVELDHLLLILCHSMRSSVSDLVQPIQVDPQLIIVAFFMEHLSFDADDSHLDRDHCLGAISESERGFSRRGSCRSPVSLQDIGQFLWPYFLSVVQPGFDDLE